MIYMAPRIAPDDYGYIATPHGQVGVHHLTRIWCGDNQVFTKKFNPTKFFAWLRYALPYRQWCKFICCPDVVGDSAATLRQYPHFAGAIHALGYPVAIAAQDGMLPSDIPCDAQALFVGGSTTWKLGDASIAIIREAQRRGMWVHVGRVNTPGRWGNCEGLRVDSVDGTKPCFEPDKSFKNISDWKLQGVFEL